MGMFLKIVALLLCMTSAATCSEYVDSTDALPRPPSKVQISNVTATSVRISWSYDIGAENIIFYAIQYKRRQANQDYNEINGILSMFYTVRGLTPYTEYEFYVIAVNSIGRGSPSIASFITTGKTALPRPPTRVQISDVTATSVKISWSYDIEEENIIYYVIKYKRRHANLEYNDISGIQSSMFYTVRDLTPNTEYEFYIIAVNSIGRGSPSLVAFATTAKIVPNSPPQNLTHKLQSPTTVVIQWDPPQYRNGYVLCYGVLFHKATEIGLEHNVTSTRKVYSSLDVNTKYVYWVRAYTFRGPGLWSSVGSVFTPGDFPPAPTKVQAMATSERTLEVWWDQVPLFMDILGYKVLYTQTAVEDLEEWNKKEVPLTSSAELTWLVSHGTYAIRVAAYTRQGIGHLSELIYVRVTPTDVPTQLRAQDVTTRGMLLTWKAPSKLDAIRYKVSYSARKKFYDSHDVLQELPTPPHVVYVEADTSELRVDNLIPFTSYQVNITAIPSDGTFRPPAKITVTTAMPDEDYEDDINNHVPSILSTEVTLNATVGQNVRFPCDVDDMGDYVMLWKYNRTRMLFAGDLRIVKDHRLYLDGTSLLVSSVEVEDHGEYVCQISTNPPPLELKHSLDVHPSEGVLNLNPPYFENSLYEAAVNEDAVMQHTVITVTAKDKDRSSRMYYEITRGNIGGAFGANNETGAIYVSAPLDYETRKEYKLRLTASDGKNENFTTVAIHIMDVNDNPPIFDRPVYETTITEEDDRNLPKRVLQITATDGDRGRKSDITYFIPENVGNDQVKSIFFINAATGEIYVNKPLDRDPPRGQSQWRFTVFAEDEGGHGLAFPTEVVINLLDINDNAPFYRRRIYTGNVAENSPRGIMVMTMTATDYDDPNVGSNARLKYSIIQNVKNDNDELIFTIDEETGVISTLVCCLDRETNPEYEIKVVAMDGGGLKGTGTATIKITDINDMPPKFTEKEWEVEVDETQGDSIPETPVLVVSVNDGDLLETNRFSYKVIDNAFGANKFTMVTNTDGTGSLKIAKPLDYEDLQQRYGFNITIQVSDHGTESSDPNHLDTTEVRIRLRDVNPEFEKPNIKVVVNEDVDIGTILATFRATDPDKGEKSRVSYTINQFSDKKQKFMVDQDGVVKTQRTLDREEAPRHEVKILAIDDGTPPRTSTATLSVNVNDINDNAPRLLRDYRQVIMENSPPQTVTKIRATDDDDRSSGNGPPFLFSMDPNASDIIKQLFEVEYDPTGANGDGMAIISTKERLDREEQKEYLVPIQIKDSGTPSMTGSGTLTVTVGDMNDNRMFPGSKSVFVYKYEDPERQSSTVHPKDVNDEPPYFINRPWPMHAVVPLNAPPGTPVFKLQARDPDTDHDIHYFLVRDRTGGRFEVDERSGEVRTLGRDPFILDKEYILYVKAEDHNGMIGDGQYQSTEEDRLSIMGGKRPPQFYKQKYYATIPKNHRRNSEIIQVKAKSFADEEIDYTLRSLGRIGFGTFNIEPTTGVVKLAKDLDYEYLRQTNTYSLIVTAFESFGGLSSSVELTINVTDANGNAPRFELPDYQADDVDKDVTIETSILQGESPPILIGRVHVEDRDDWDLPDKLFFWRNDIAHPNFELEKGTGLLRMKSMTDNGTYFLRFVVYDRVHTQEVFANVSVIVKEIPEETIFNSGSIRISGISAEDFVRVWNRGKYRQDKSMYLKFRNTIANLTETQQEKVDIFSVIQKQKYPLITDVRFRVNASLYFKSSKLNAIVALNRERIAQEVGINITMVGIDDCLMENPDCKTGCTNVFVLDRHPILIDANRTSLIGVNTWIQPKCICDPADAA